MVFNLNGAIFTVLCATAVCIQQAFLVSAKDIIMENNNPTNNQKTVNPTARPDRGHNQNGENTPKEQEQGPKVEIEETETEKSGERTPENNEATNTGEQKS